MHIVFAGGGTGGHVYPLGCLAHAVRRLRPDARLTFVTTDRAIDGRVIGKLFGTDARGVAICPQVVRPLPRTFRESVGFLPAWRASVSACRSLFASDRPAAVIGSGGYGSGPAICAAATMGIRSAILNPDAIPGKANRYLARRAETVFVQWAIAAAHLPATADVRLSGCPVRSAFMEASRSDGISRFGLNPAMRTLVITGASQGSRSINQAVVAGLTQWSSVPGWQMVHLAGPGEANEVRRVYTAASASAVVLEYTEDMAELLAAADLVVGRAGASTLAEITAVGVASVLMPYPYHRDGHQRANASVLEEAGAAEIVEDRIEPAANVDRLVAVVTRLMRDEETLDRMGRSAARLGRCDASKTIAEWLVDGNPGSGDVAIAKWRLMRMPAVGR